MNREDLQGLAEERLTDAKVLFDNDRFSAAYYLAGYAVEYALKACIANLTKEGDFPDKDLANKAYTHDLQRLADAAGLKLRIDRLSMTDASFKANWALTSSWSPESRYETHGKPEVKDVMEAINEPRHGVLQCLKRYWNDI